MKKRPKWKRFTAVATGTMLLAATAAGGVAALPVSAAENVYNLDVAKSFQEFDGWGLSLSWWATEIGDWTRTGSSGMQKREEIMEAIYGESGLNLNIARYNVGGGDDPSHTHMTDDRNTPGWRGATKTTVEDAEGNEYSTYAVDKNYAFTAADGSTLSWQDTPDWRQLWVLDWIQNYRTEDLITEYYSNSPPYWMTKTGCSSGGEGGGQNLDSENNQLFVDYFLDVYEYLVSQGFTFENLQPFNESGSYYWGEGGDQEGCYFSATQKVEVLNLLRKGLEERGIEINYNWGDETNCQEDGGVAQNQYNSAKRYTNGDVVGADIVNGASRVTYHIYDYDVKGARMMYRNAKANGQEIYMSEITWTAGDEYDSNDMSTGFEYVQSILDTVKYGGVDAYVFWQGVEDMLGQMKSGTNYGLIQGVYQTQDEAQAQGFDIAAMGLNYQDYVCSKAYYMSGQYTKYINKGYTIIDIDDAGSMAAISPDGETVVVVKLNRDGNPEPFTLNLGGFKANSVEKIYTDKTHNWVHSAISTNGNSISDTVNATSVTTYVIHGSRTGRAGHFIDDSWAVKCSNLEAIQAAIDENEETEQIYGTYDYTSYDNDHLGDRHGTPKIDSYFGTTSTNATHYMVFRFKGVGFDLTSPTKSDAGKIRVWVDQSPSEADGESINLKTSDTVVLSSVFSKKDLTDGWHTVYVKSDGGWVNFDGAFVYTAYDAQAESETLVVTEASGFNGTVKFNYNAEDYAEHDIFAEYRAGGDWTRTEALTGGSGTIENIAAASIELRLVAVKDENEIVTPASVVTITDVPATDGVLYFVDAGTSDSATLSTGAVLGTLQSSSDKAYGGDLFTGASWGYTNSITGSETGYNGTYEAMSSVMSADKISEGKNGAIQYKFDIPNAGKYHVALTFFGCNWGARNETITLKYESETETDTVTVNGINYNICHFAIETSTDDVVLTVEVQSTTDNEGALLSAIVITDEDTALALYSTNGASNFNTESAARGGKVAIGEDIYAKVKEDSVIVQLSNGETATIDKDYTGHASYYMAVNQMVAGGRVPVVISAEEFPGFEATITYSWTQAGAEELYYNIDCGFVDTAGTPPEDSSQLGSKQSSTRDREYGADSAMGTEWGYVGSHFSEGVNWGNNGSNEWSIREAKDSGNTLTYKMTGFMPNEPLKIMTGGHCGSNWGGRTYTVKCNDTEIGVIKLENGVRTYETFTDNVSADASGELTITYTKKTGDNPQVGYIKVWSIGEAPLDKDATISSDKTTVARNEKVTLRNLNTNAMVYLLDENNVMVGNFKPTFATAEITVGDYLPETSYELHIVQAQINTAHPYPTTEVRSLRDGTNVSAELVIDVPDVDIVLEQEWVGNGSATAILFRPHAANGVTSISLTTPYGVTVNLIEDFFFRAKVNGEYTVKMVSNGATVEKSFTVANVDLVSFEATFSTLEWTKDPVTVTLDIEATSGISSVEINGAPAAVEGDGYKITATENGEYEVTVKTEAGFVYNRTVTVENIDKTEPQLELSIDFSVAAGVALDHNAVSQSGGKLFVSHDGGAKTEITESSAFTLDKEGKYEISFTSGTGKETQTQVYYVTYGTEKAQLATVTVAKDGTVTVADKARANAVANLYRAGESTPIDSMKAEKAGKYFLEIENGGETEVVVFTVAANVSGSGIVDGTGSSGGSVGGMVAGIVIGCTALIAAGVVCTLFILKGRKKQ